MPGLVPIGDHRLKAEHPAQATVHKQRLHRWPGCANRATACSQRSPWGANGLPARYSIGDVIRGNQAGTAHRLRSTCCTGSSALPSKGFSRPAPVYSKTNPVPPPMPILAINARIISLAVTPVCRLPIEADLASFGLALQQALGCQDMLDLARYRYQRPVPRMRRVWQCDCHHRRWSSRAGSGPAQAR